MVSEVAQPPYDAAKPPLFNTVRFAISYKVASHPCVTTPSPSLKRRGVSANFQFIHSFCDRPYFVDSTKYARSETAPTVRSTPVAPFFVQIRP